MVSPLVSPGGLVGRANTVTKAGRLVNAGEELVNAGEEIVNLADETIKVVVEITGVDPRGPGWLRGVEMASDDLIDAVRACL